MISGEKKSRRVISLSLLLAFLCVAGVWAETLGGFTVTSSNGRGYSYDNRGGVLTVSSGEVTVSNNRSTADRIKLTGGKLILNGVTISTGNGAPIEVSGTATINLANGKTNTLTSTSASYAGIYVPSTSQVTFTGGGTLTAKSQTTSTASSTGIGGQQASNAYSCGTIIFDLTGTITATGGNRAAGIGTCMSSSGRTAIAGTIQVKNGTINATGGNNAGGIGTGPNGGTNSVKVILEGGTINANVAPGSSANPFNTLIVGPDVTVTGGKTISNSYTNGFVFSGNPKKATVKGNPTLPGNASITIDSNETLTLPETTNLKNDGTIIVNGGSIVGDGTISGNLPVDNTRNNKYYKVEYNLNGGSGTKPVGSYQLVNSNFTLAGYEGITKGDDICIGWATTMDATEAITTATIQAKTNTFYATWTKKLELTQSSKDITGTVGEPFATVDLSSFIKNKNGSYSFKVKSGNTLPDDFILGATDGKLSSTALTQAIDNKEVIIVISKDSRSVELTLTFKIAKGNSSITFTNLTSGKFETTYGTDLLPATTTTGSKEAVTITYYTNQQCTEGATTTKPVNAGTYYVKAALAADANYNAAVTAAVPYIINKKELLVTPNAGQFVYKNEEATYVPTFTVGDTYNNQVYSTTGKLAWEKNNNVYNITKGSLALADNAAGNFLANNYKLELSSSSVAITVYDKTLDEAYEEVAEAIKQLIISEEWKTADIVLTIPSNFKLKDLSGNAGWVTSATISAEGEYLFKYKLMRDERSESAEFSAKVKLDKTNPEVRNTPTTNKLRAIFTLLDETSGIASYKYKLDGVEGNVVNVSNAPKSHPVTIDASEGEHTIIFTVTDVAGNTKTANQIIFTLNAGSEEPEPTPDVYTITLPSVEGVTTNPSAGDYDVNEGESFSFTLTLAEGYTENSHPVVSTDRGNIIEASADGTYVIEDVQRDIVITISGIEADQATANATIDADVRIRAIGSTLLISVPAPVEASIIDLSGRLIRSVSLPAGETRITDLHSGIYIVKLIGEDGKKIVIR